MKKIEVKVYSVELGELPGTDRIVLGWGKHSSMKEVRYIKTRKSFYWGQMEASVEFWTYMEPILNNHLTG